MVKLWNSEWGNCIVSLKAHKMPATTLAFNTDSSLLASGGDDMRVQIHRTTAPYQNLSTLTAHYGAVRGVCFSASGSFLFSAAEDHTVRAWLPTDKEVTNWTQVGLFAAARPLQ